MIIITVYKKYFTWMRYHVVIIYWSQIQWLLTLCYNIDIIMIISIKTTGRLNFVLSVYGTSTVPYHLVWTFPILIPKHYTVLVRSRHMFYSLSWKIWKFFTKEWRRFAYVKWKFGNEFKKKFQKCPLWICRRVVRLRRHGESIFETNFFISELERMNMLNVILFSETRF